MILPTEQPLSSHEADLNEIFEKPDLSIIKSILYFDGWSDYEEFGGILIFRGIDDSIQSIEYGYSVMSSDNTNYFTPVEISLERAIEMITEMKEMIEKVGLSIE